MPAIFMHHDLSVAAVPYFYLAFSEFKQKTLSSLLLKFFKSATLNTIIILKSYNFSPSLELGTVQHKIELTVLK